MIFILDPSIKDQGQVLSFLSNVLDRKSDQGL